MPTYIARPTKIAPVEIRDLDGNAVRPGQSMPTLRRTASGRLFIPREPPAPLSSRKLQTVDTIRALVPQMHSFSSGDEHLVVKDAPAHQVSIVPPSPKLYVYKRRTPKVDVLRRQGRMRVNTEGVHRRSCAGDLGNVSDGLETTEPEVSLVRNPNSKTLKSVVHPAIRVLSSAPETRRRSTASVDTLTLPRGSVNLDGEEQDLWATTSSERGVKPYERDTVRKAGGLYFW